MRQILFMAPTEGVALHHMLERHPSLEKTGPKRYQRESPEEGVLAYAARWGASLTGRQFDEIHCIAPQYAQQDELDLLRARLRPGGSLYGIP